MTMRIFPGWGWIVFPGCWALIGPQVAMGPLNGELSVKCSYDRGYENYFKYWCRGPSWKDCHTTVKTSGSEATVKDDRASIRDHHTSRMFIVTMKKLTKGDSGIYWCGIEKWGLDLMVSVTVSVLPAKPASTTPASEKASTMDAASTKSPFTWTVPEVTDSNATVHSSAPPPRTTDPVLHILTPCILVVLLLIVLTAIVFIKKSRRRNKALEGAPGQREKNFHLYRLVPGKAPSFVTNSHTACSEATICMNVEKSPSSAAPKPVYENTVQRDPGFRMNRKNCSGQSDISSFSTYVNMKPNTRSRTSPSHCQQKHGGKATG